MKRLSVLIILILVTALNIYSDDFRIGGAAGVGFAYKPSTKDIIEEYEKEFDVFPGFFWEVTLGRFGFGMTHLLKFNKLDSDLPNLENKWHFEWIGSFDLRFHILDKVHLDPFIVTGIGCAGSVDITNYSSEGYNRDKYADDLLLSIFGQIGAGLNFKFDNIIFGGQLAYIFYNEIPPATNFDPYPLKNFEFTITLGALLGNDHRNDYDDDDYGYDGD
jgi:hypothetical protein